jgi:CRISPR-associated protein Cas5d
MDIKTYEIKLEISGPCAIWTRPDTGDSPGTYPAPTRSAAKGIFESILWNPAVEIEPFKVEICAPLIYHAYATNYGGPLRKREQITGDHNYQLFATVLVNVCYRLHAKLKPVERVDFPPKILQWLARTRSPAHAFKEIFERRLKRGQCYAVPSLGWREFVPDYLGDFRPETRVQTDIDLTLPTMLDYVFPNGLNSAYAPKFVQGLAIKAGVLWYGGDDAQ